MPCRTRASLICLVIGAVFQVELAHAGAWPQESGRLQVISRITSTVAPQAYDARGNTVDGADFEKTELDVYAEYGLRDWATLLVKPTFQHVIAGPKRQTGLATIEAGARARLWAFEDMSVLSFQVSTILPMREHDSQTPLLTSGHADYDMRLLRGVPDSLLGWPTFSDMQIAYRHRGGHAPDEVRVDTAYGVHVAAEWTVMTQTQSAVTIGMARAPFRHSQSHKAQASLRWRFSPGRYLEIGGLHTIAGAQTVRESGGFLSLWVTY